MLLFWEGFGPHPTVHIAHLLSSWYDYGFRVLIGSHTAHVHSPVPVACQPPAVVPEILDVAQASKGSPKSVLGQTLAAAFSAQQ